MRDGAVASRSQPVGEDWREPSGVTRRHGKMQSLRQGDNRRAPAMHEYVVLLSSNAACTTESAASRTEAGASRESTRDCSVPSRAHHFPLETAG